MAEMEMAAIGVAEVTLESDEETDALQGPPPPPDRIAGGRSGGDAAQATGRRTLSALKKFRQRLARPRGAEPEPEPEPEPDDDAPVGLARAPSARSVRRRQREARLLAITAEVEDTSPSASALVRTPSAIADMQAAAGDDTATQVQKATRAQRLRRHLRLIDADIAEVNAELVRRRVLRGASGERFECDADCIVGGCGESFAEEEGVLCGGCKLFLCYPCFGQSVVLNECQISGRFDKTVAGAGSDEPSEPGSLPCPLFPQSCSCGHIPLHTVQRALLHPENRGRDGPDEDVRSAGHSAHKVHLLARRRQAEAEAEAAKVANGGGDGAEDEGVALVRTFTERVARTTNATLARADGTISSLAGLADKLDELDELKMELASEPPVSAIPLHLRRRCVQCNDELGAFEGADCQYFSNRVERHSHFLCAVCFGGYLMRACSPGGVFEQEIVNDKGTVVSAKGQLPCPFFQHLESQLVPRLGRQQRCMLVDGDGDGAAFAAEPPKGQPPISMPAMECRCGAVPMSEIETALLDPRNNSYQYWRHRHADAVVWSHADSTITIEAAAPEGAADELPPGWVVQLDDHSGQEFYYHTETQEIAFEKPSSIEWTREAELVGRGYTPANLHETARLRVAIEENNLVEMGRLQALEDIRKKETDPNAVALAELRDQVIAALDRGGTIRCPSCGVMCLKNDACIHMDSCPCHSSWCFLCGKSKSECPRGRGGCDEGGYYLEQKPGWGNFAIEGIDQNAAMGAQQEFLRRRQAFMVRAVMEHTEPTLWSTLQEKHPDLLSNTPTQGREIPWDSVPAADMPLFGAKLRAFEEAGGSGAGGEDAARQRLQQYWEDVRLERVAEELLAAQRWRHQMCCVPLVAILAAVLVIGTSLLFAVHPPPNPIRMVWMNDTSPASQAAQLVPESDPTATPAVSEPELNATASGRVCKRTLTSALVPIQSLGAADTEEEEEEEEGVIMACDRQNCTSLSWAHYERYDDEAVDEPVQSVRIPILSAIDAVLQPVISLQDCQEWCRQSASCETWQFYCNDAAWSRGPADTLCTDGHGGCLLKAHVSDEEELNVDGAAVVQVYEGSCLDSMPAFECGASCQLLRWIPIAESVIYLLGAIGVVLQAIKEDEAVPGFFLACGAALGFLMFLFPRNVFLELGTDTPGEDLLELGWFSAYILVPFFGMMSTLGIVGFMMIILSDDGDEFEGVAACLPVCVCVLYSISMSFARDGDSDVGTIESGFSGTFEFDCNWVCQSIVWIPRAIALAGSSMLLVSLLSVCFVRDDRDEEDLVKAVMASVLTSPMVFWVATMEPIDFVYMNVFSTYFLAPLCSSLFSVGWFVMQLATVARTDLFHNGRLMRCTDLLINGRCGRYFRNNENKFLSTCMCTSFTLFVYYIVVLARTRATNDDLILPPAPDFAFVCEAECLWLTWAPRMTALVGAVCMVITGLCDCCGRRDPDQDAGVPTVVSLVFAVGGIIPFWPLAAFFDAKGFMTAPFLMAYFVLPFCCAFLSTVWIFLPFFFALQGIGNSSVENMMTARTAFITLATSSCGMTIAYVASMSVLRHSSWIDATSTSSATTTSSDDLHVDVSPADYGYGDDFEYLYELTWPSVALRVFFAVMAGSFASSLALLWARKVLALANVGWLAWGCLCIPQFAFMALAALAAVEGAIGWPVEVPVELLLTAKGAWLYTLAPLASVLLFFCSWKVIYRTQVSARMRLVSDAWDMPSIIVALSTIGSAWLLAVLRHSASHTDHMVIMGIDGNLLSAAAAAAAAGQNQNVTGLSSSSSPSHRAQIVMWECIGICYCGLVGLIYCWNFRRAEARRRACGIMYRVLVLWMPAAIWPLLPAIWYSESDDDGGGGGGGGGGGDDDDDGSNGRAHAIDTILSDTDSTLYWVLVVSLSVSTGGFAGEWAAFNHFRAAERCGRSSVGMALLVLVLSLGLLAVNLLCVAPASVLLLSIPACDSIG